MAAVIHRAPQVGHRLVVVAEHRGDQGRRSFTAASLYDGAELIATAEHTWVAIDPADFG